MLPKEVHISLCIYCNILINQFNEAHYLTVCLVGFAAVIIVLSRIFFF
jgi:hypothetical protein